ncbi:MAG: leucine-rich repeat domain-containing protein [Marinilabiliaceae bacterium]|nr:leucine-rich repeat domain-containing protein [Marinilabiliaceae bacterium]
MRRNVIIDVSDGVSLQEALKKAGVNNLSSVDKLTVTGIFNHVHFKEIFEKKETVRELDLSTASYNPYFYEKGDYYSYRYSAKNKYNDLYVSSYGYSYNKNNNKSLISISFPSSVEKLKVNLFDLFQKLETITVADDHKSYLTEDGILFNKDKTKIIRFPAGKKGKYVIPNTVVEIEENAFKECVGLTTIIIPDTVLKIGKNAFRECKGLKSINIPKKTIEIGSYAFCDCSGLTSFIIPETETKIKDSFLSGCSDLTSINIPETVVEIGRKAFEGCTGLTFITIPMSVEYIGNSAFSGCKGLKSVKILNKAIKLGDHVFYNCSELTSLEMHKSVAYKKNEAFAHCEKLPLYINLKREEKNNQIKQNKIRKLKTTSAYDWLENLMKNSKYTYKIITHFETKLQLKVKINEKTKLEIPVPYSKFQKILPKLMDAIKRFEEAINDFDFVFVEKINTDYDKTGWINE